MTGNDVLTLAAFEAGAALSGELSGGDSDLRTNGAKAAEKGDTVTTMLANARENRSILVAQQDPGISVIFCIFDEGQRRLVAKQDGYSAVW